MTSVNESAVAQVAATGEEVPKPASQPYYKSPAEINASWLVFEKKPERAAKVAAVKTTTFAVGMNPPSTSVAAPVAAPQEAGRGGRGGRGRGGRGGRGAAQKLGSLAIKISAGMRTKYGINVSIPTVGGEKDMTLVNYLKEHPRHINAMAAGMIPTPPGVHFEILFFLDPLEPEHQRLEELSNECRDAFETYVWDSGVPVKQDLKTNGFVRVSDKTEERYIVMMMSTMHTVDSAKFFPTPFYSQTNEPILWDALVNHSFRAEIEFKVSHVMLVGTDKASFKSYVSSCKLVEEPKLAMSDKQLVQQAFLDKMKDAVKQANALASASGEEQVPFSLTAEDAGAAALAALTAAPAPVQPAAKVRKTKTVAAAVPVVPVVKVKAKKVVTAPPAPLPVEEDDEPIEEDEDPAEAEEEAMKTPVPESVMKNLSRPRRTA